MSPKLPVVSARQFIKILLKDGFYKSRQTGSHAIYKRESDKRIVVVALHSSNETIPIGTLRRMIKDAGWTVEEFIGFK